LFLLVWISRSGKIRPTSERLPDWIISVTSERNFMSAKYRPTFLILLALLSALSLLGCRFGQQTAEDFSNRGKAKMAKGDQAGADEDLAQAAKLQGSTESAGDFVNRGNAEMAKGDLDGAIADYTKVIELEPEYAPAYLNRGFAKANKGDLDGAIADYNRAIEINPKYADAYYSRGYAKKAKGDQAGADEDLAQAAKLQGH
jgi:tetratricopeptide (TPR) repeat protein